MATSGGATVGGADARLELLEQGPTQRGRPRRPLTAAAALLLGLVPRWPDAQEEGVLRHRL